MPPGSCKQCAFREAPKEGVQLSELTKQVGLLWEAWDTLTQSHHTPAWSLLLQLISPHSIYYCALGVPRQLEQNCKQVELSA